MKELVIISGKGGTGKTSMCAAIAVLSSLNHKTVFADCDVDAADLHLIFSPVAKNEHDFISGHEAAIDNEICTSCGLCRNLCRFDAIRVDDKNRYSVDQTSCEGCGVCVRFCKRKAIAFNDRKCGRWFVSESRFGTLVHAELDASAENSGKLVSVVRREARIIGHEENAELLITDGPPGTGCPVIASITGADAVLIVAEPSRSGLHDLIRAAELTAHFKIPLFVCVNKHDINPEITSEIKALCEKNRAVFAGTVAYDRQFTAAQIAGKSITETDNEARIKEIETIWHTVMTQLTKR